jgi:hypothetical protein
MQGKYGFGLRFLLWSILLLATFLFENILRFFDTAIYRIFTQPHLKLMMIGIIGGCLLPMIAVVICIGIIGGLWVKGNKYSGFIATVCYCFIWNSIGGFKFWATTVWSIPGLILHLSIPFIGGYVYMKLNAVRIRGKLKGGNETESDTLNEEDFVRR